MLVRLWASARAAAGVDAVEVEVGEPITLADLRARLVSDYPGELERVLPTCSVLVGDQPMGSRDPHDVVIAPDATVEFLPPFAGG